MHVIILILINILISLFLLFSTSNRIHSILYLINIYASMSFYFMYLGVHIIGLFYFIVYIGAIAMLFLFSIMILDVKLELRGLNFLDQFIFIFSLIYFIFLILEFNLFFLINEYEYMLHIDDILKLMGYLIFDLYYILFLLSGLILLIALIGSILLTNKKYGYIIKKQERSFFDSVLYRNRYILLST
jgi:NADH-quinone oxidoreductase subunit J